MQGASISSWNGKSSVNASNKGNNLQSNISIDQNHLIYFNQTPAIPPNKAKLDKFSSPEVLQFSSFDVSSILSFKNE